MHCGGALFGGVEDGLSEEMVVGALDVGGGVLLGDSEGVAWCFPLAFMPFGFW